MDQCLCTASDICENSDLIIDNLRWNYDMSVMKYDFTHLITPAAESNPLIITLLKCININIYLYQFT